MDSKPRKQLTLCLVHDHPRILLGMKKKGFGAGRWNGFGGKVQEGETVEEAAIRELKEECGLDAGSIEKRGILRFDFTDDFKENAGISRGNGLEMHVFKVLDYKGEPIESDEMRPQWFNLEEIPFRQMWSSDLFWLPLFIKGRKFKGRFLFDQPSTTDYDAKILEREIREVSELD